MRRAGLLGAAVALALALGLGGCGDGDGPGDAAGRPGSTLRATVADPAGNGVLRPGAGEPLADRTELGRRVRGPVRELARVGQLTDLHVRDEESPGRAPFLDRLGPPVTSTFRPHEALSTQVVAAALRALAAERPSAVLLTGDLIDSAQRDELDQLLAVLGGGRVRPDSGGGGYRGVQEAGNPDGFFYRPDLDAPRLPGLLDRAQRPFTAPGLGARWLPALGNHDLLVQGELPPSARTDAVAAGDRALLTFDPSLRDLLDDLPSETGRAGATPDLRDVPPEAVDALLAQGVPGRAAQVPADSARRHLRPAEAVARLARASRAPASGGRLDYVADLAPGVRAIVLDTVDRAGGAGGVLGAAGLAFLRTALSEAGDRAIVVVDHHGLHRARDAAAARALLAGDDRVVAELTGDTHRHEIEPVRTPAGGYWRITTASLADWPQQGRMLRLITAPGGARAIETWVVDHAGRLDENADLAGSARRLAYLDAQGGRPNGFRGRRRDRNVRLWLPAR